MSDPERPPEPIDETPGPRSRPLSPGAPNRREGPAKTGSDDAGPSGVPEGPPQDQEDPHGEGETRGPREG